MATSISQLISEDRVLLPIRSSGKKDVLTEIVGFLVRATGREDLREAILEGALEREMEISTGIGRGIAIPHAEIRAEIEPLAVIGVSPEGVDFEALDSNPVHVVFLLVCPAEARKERLAILSSLSRLFCERSLVRELKKARCEADVVERIRHHEEKG